MYGLYLGLGALALGSVNAWSYPDCVCWILGFGKE
jgi:hypothetical protein